MTGNLRLRLYGEAQIKHYASNDYLVYVLIILVSSFISLFFLLLLPESFFSYKSLDLKLGFYLFGDFDFSLCMNIYLS